MYLTTTISVSVHRTIDVAPTTSSFVGWLENTDGQRYRGEVPGVQQTLSSSALLTERMAVSQLLYGDGEANQSICQCYLDVYGLLLDMMVTNRH